MKKYLVFVQMWNRNYFVWYLRKTSDIYEFGLTEEVYRADKFNEEEVEILKKEIIEWRKDGIKKIDVIEVYENE